jgi:hypothetical protein
MSTSPFQLALDLLLFSIVHVSILLPLIRRALVYIIQKDNITPAPSTVFSAEINTTQTTANHEIYCDMCDKLAETEDEKASFVVSHCGCTWCEGCVQESFEAVMFDVDAPLQLSTSFAHPNGEIHTIRKMLPEIKQGLSPDVTRYIEQAMLKRQVLVDIDHRDNEWMLDFDEE